jgi:hypothetical protein
VEPVKRLQQRPALALSLIGALSLLLYALLALRYPLAPSLADPRASWIHLVTPSGGALAVHLGIYLALTLLYILALRLSTHIAAKTPETQSGKEAKAQITFGVTGVAEMSPDVIAAGTVGRMSPSSNVLYPEPSTATSASLLPVQNTPATQRRKEAKAQSTFGVTGVAEMSPDVIAAGTVGRMSPSSNVLYPESSSATSASMLPVQNTPATQSCKEAKAQSTFGVTGVAEMSPDVIAVGTVGRMSPSSNVLYPESSSATSASMLPVQKTPATQRRKEAKAQSTFGVTGVADTLPDVALQHTARKQTLVIVVVWLACSCALLFMSPSGESHDIFDYTFRGRMMVELGANPLAEPPIDFRSAAFFSYLAWHSHVDTYGPLWEMASAGVAISVRTVLQMFGLWKPTELACPQAADACRTLIGYLTGYRLLAIGLTGVSALLLASMVRRSRPELVNATLVAWLWSPLVLIATGVGAHNDAVMMPILLAMLWLVQRQRWLLALLALILAAHVKLTALMLTPLIGLWIVRRCGWRRAIGLALAATGIGLLLSWLLYAPFGGWGTLPRMLAERSIFLANSPWHVLSYHLYVRLQWPYLAVWRLTVQASTWLFVSAAVLLSLWLLDFRPRRWRQSPAQDWSDERVLWRAVTMISLLYLLVGAFWFQHWYVLWVAAPAALIPDSRFTRSLLPWLGFGALSANVASAHLLAAVPRGQPRTGIYSLIVAIIWGPIALAAIAGRSNRTRYAD